MNDDERRRRNAVQLAQCWGPFGDAVRLLIRRLEASLWRPRVQDAWRSPAAQLAAYQAGRSHLEYGFHNVVNDDGRPESLAVDLIDDDNPLASGPRYCVALAAEARAVGLETGLTWGLPPALVGGVMASVDAYARMGVAAFATAEPSKRIGWDPTHVQPTGLTPAQAKQGRRPALPPAA